MILRKEDIYTHRFPQNRRHSTLWHRASWARTRVGQEAKEGEESITQVFTGVFMEMKGQGRGGVP